MSKSYEPTYPPKAEPQYAIIVDWARQVANLDHRLEWCFTTNLPVDGRSPGVEVTAECDHAQVAIIRLGITEDTSGLASRPPRQPDRKLIGRLEGDS